jgi:hypothetical protein
MKNIKNWKSFNETVKEEIPEITSLDSNIFDTITFNKINRELTDNELKLVDEYASKFEKAFLLTEEDIRNVLLDIDLIDSSLKVKIRRFLTLDKEHSVDFDARKEMRDSNSFISLKRYYDNYTNKLMTPIDTISIRKESDYNKSFDNIEIYKYLEMIKGTLEDMCNCKVELDKGGAYQVSLKIIYPKTIIK